MGNTIITIGREFGSGGREFGRRLAEELGYEYYDKEIITESGRWHRTMSGRYRGSVPLRLCSSSSGRTGRVPRVLR